MRHVPLDDLKANAKELAAFVDAGEELVITLDGRDFKLVAAPDRATLDRRRRAFEQLTAFREDLKSKGVRVTRAEIKEWINEGRP